MRCLPTGNDGSVLAQAAAQLFGPINSSYGRTRGESAPQEEKKNETQTKTQQKHTHTTMLMMATNIDEKTHPTQNETNNNRAAHRLPCTAKQRVARYNNFSQSQLEHGSRKPCRAPSC